MSASWTRVQSESPNSGRWDLAGKQGMKITYDDRFRIFIPGLTTIKKLNSQIGTIFNAHKSYLIHVHVIRGDLTTLQ